MTHSVGDERRYSHCVIGSGPSGVACASALLARGANVTMIDAGVSLEDARQTVIDDMQALPPERWRPEQVRLLKAGMESTTEGIPLKLAFGSDFPYREYDQQFPTSYQSVALRPSLARGGLSTVWGAAMLPYTDAHVRGWPIGISDLAPHYSAVTELTGMAACEDDLARDFPIYAKDPAPLASAGRRSGCCHGWSSIGPHCAAPGFSSDRPGSP